MIERRGHLIDKELSGTMLPHEEVELRQLDRMLRAYRHKVAPLPIEAARKLHRSLLARAVR